MAFNNDDLIKRKNTTRSPRLSGARLRTSAEQALAISGVVNKGNGGQLIRDHAKPSIWKSNFSKALDSLRNNDNKYEPRDYASELNSYYKARADQAYAKGKNAINLAYQAGSDEIDANIAQSDNDFNSAIRQNALNWFRSNRASNEQASNNGTLNSGTQSRSDRASNIAYGNQETSLLGQKATARNAYERQRTQLKAQREASLADLENQYLSTLMSFAGM